MPQFRGPVFQSGLAGLKIRRVELEHLFAERRRLALVSAFRSSSGNDGIIWFAHCVLQLTRLAKGIF